MAKNTRIKIITLGSLALLGLFIIGKAGAALLNNTMINKTPLDPYEDQIEYLLDELKRTDLTDETRRLEEEKLNTLVRMATQRAHGMQNQPARQGNVTPPTIQVAGMRLPDGIDNHPSVPFSEDLVKVVNSWRKTTPERTYLVFAGYLTKDPEQGALLVFRPDTHNFTPYLTPGRSGEVSVIEEKGFVIVLKSRRGDVYYFNVAQEYFIDERGTPLPTIDAIQTISPTMFTEDQGTPIAIPKYP